MGIFFGVVIWVLTAAAGLVVWFANSMSDAPMGSRFSLWPILSGGFVLGALVFASHWVSW